MNKSQISQDTTQEAFKMNFNTSQLLQLMQLVENKKDADIKLHESLKKLGYEFSEKLHDQEMDELNFIYEQLKKEYDRQTAHSGSIFKSYKSEVA